MTQRYIRKRPFRPLRQKILIVCEGEKTEPNYFRAFSCDQSLVKVDVLGAGKNTKSLVEHAIELKLKSEKNLTPYNRIWCVFDRDSFPSQQFNEAIQLARKHQLFVAYSNEAFEIWYILHFNYHQTATNRQDYKKLLTKLLGRKYKKKDPTMYDTLKTKQKYAIEFAKKLLVSHPINNPETNNPSTTVHMLVEYLNNYLEIP